MHQPLGLHTDHYELTMVEAALRAGIAERQTVFEVFVRSLPPGRAHGVFAGLGRLLDAVPAFRFGPEELGHLEAQGFLAHDTIDWLAAYHFAGSIDAYREGELYVAGSPVLTVQAGFAEALVLETMVLSILNHDSAVAAAAARLVDAAGGRPIIEMGSRRVHEEAAVAAARAAYIAGFASTSNLEAGRRYGIPTAGTAGHALVLASPDERSAFAAQVAAFGTDTVLLVDTFDVAAGIDAAVAVAGPSLRAIRIDSGDLGAEAARARAQLDRLGATSTGIVVSGDLDDAALLALAAAPIDAYGIGTAAVTGGGWPTAGLIYKLVAVADGPGQPRLRPVGKRSPGKPTAPGRKTAWRRPGPGPVADREVVLVAGDPPAGARSLQVRVVEAGAVVHRPTLEDIEDHHRRAKAEIGEGPT